VSTHSMSSPAVQLILSGQSKHELTVTFDVTRLDALTGRRRDARAPCSWTRQESPQSRSTPLAELSQVGYATTLAKS